MRKARAQLAPPNPPPITTTRGASGLGDERRRKRSSRGACRRGRCQELPPMDAGSGHVGFRCRRGRPAARMFGKEKAAAPEGRRFVVAYTSSMPWFFSGIERMRLPVALKNALSTAGAATQIVGSPTPPHGPSPPDWMMIDSTFGIWPIRIEL